MSSARDEILARVRTALSDVPTAEEPRDVEVTRDYRVTDRAPAPERLERLVERLRDYGAEVVRMAADGVAEAAEQACRQRGLRRLAVAAGLPVAWRPAGPELIVDDGLTADQLDRVDGALTGCALAIAETGTLVLDGGASCGRRILTLVPDHHICVVLADQIAGTVPEAIRHLDRPAGTDWGPVTFVSGPSASSDIELSRVQGVHGPRHLVVLIAG